jgi:hypothetical protein
MERLNLCVKKYMNLIIDSIFTEPPSEVSCFRDVTLYSKIFIFEDILLECPIGTRSMYWRWLKKHGAHDFVSDLILNTEKEYGIKISPNKGNIIIPEIKAENLSHILKCLKVYSVLNKNPKIY